MIRCMHCVVLQSKPDKIVLSCLKTCWNVMRKIIVTKIPKSSLLSLYIYHGLFLPVVNVHNTTDLTLTFT